MVNRLALISAIGRNLRLLVGWCNFLDQTSDAFLESAILCGVYEGIDAAVGEHQHHGQVVVPAAEVDRVAQKVEKEQKLVWRPACEIYAAYDQRRDECAAPSFGDGRVTSGCHLKYELRGGYII